MTDKHLPQLDAGTGGSIEALIQNWRLRIASWRKLADDHQTIRNNALAEAELHAAVTMQICADELAALLTRRDQPEPAYWRCRTCGCLWRDNHDGSVSLGSVKQTSCDICETKPTPDVCEPLWTQAWDQPEPAQFHRYTITSEGASKGYFRLIEDPEGAWVTFAEVEAAATRRDQPEPQEELDARLLAWAVINCHTLARRALARTTSVYDREKWEHVLRICEKAGARSQGVLRASVPTEVTEGSEPATRRDAPQEQKAEDLTRVEPLKAGADGQDLPRSGRGEKSPL